MISKTIIQVNNDDDDDDDDDDDNSKKRYTRLPEGTDIHIQQHNHQKYLNPCLSRYYYRKVIAELENSKQ